MTERYRTQIKMGERYRDSVTGYEGVATAVIFFLNGCERVTLEQWVHTAGELRELTFDAPRLVVAATEQPITTTRTGGSRPTPPRSGAR